MVIRGRIAVATDPLLARLGYRPTRRSLGFIEQALAAAHERAIADHTPPPYAGKVYLFRAEQQRRGLPPDPTLGLKSVLEGPSRLQLHRVSNKPCSANPTCEYSPQESPPLSANPNRQSQGRVLKHLAAPQLRHPS